MLATVKVSIDLVGFKLHSRRTVTCSSVGRRFSSTLVPTFPECNGTIWDGNPAIVLVCTDRVPPGLDRHKTRDEAVVFGAKGLAEMLPRETFVLARRNRRRFKSCATCGSFFQKSHVSL